jgi:predicted KAP-like P-loop ATPase
MWNDNETHQDLIDFKYLTDSVNLIINNDNLIPSTIGIYGDWGSGKSSLMKMIELENTKEDYLIIKFNGWLFEGYEDAKIALLTTLIDEIIKSRTWDEKAKKYLSRLVKRIKWLKVITKVGSISINTYMANQTNFDFTKVAADIAALEIDDYIKEVKDENQSMIDKGIREFHKDFESLLKETKLKRVIVLIDDLDRCNPDTIISTLEAIKLFLFVEKSVFIISADERLINYAVKKRFPELPSTDYDVSKDYIEKLIHFPIRIPSLSEVEYEAYINLLFAQLHLNPDEFEKLRSKVFAQSNDIDLSVCKLTNENIQNILPNVSEDMKKDFILSKQINPILVSVLSGNPRQCKRFLNMMMLRLNMSISKGVTLKKNVLAKLMLLEYFKTESFNKLVKASYEVEDNILSLLENSSKQIPKSFESWNSDSWLKKWMDIEPKLGEENLKLYFYFTKSKNNIEFTTNKRLSEEAKIILKNLFESDLVSKNAIRQSSQLSSVDKNAIFSELTNKLITEEDLTKRGNLNKILVLFVKQNDILISEYCAFMENISESILMASNVPNLMTLTKNTVHQEYGTSILEKWSKSSNSTLATASKNKLK